MIRLALAQPGTAVLSFDLCCATPVLPVATGRQCSPPRQLLPREAINAPRQRAASLQIPIASDAQLRHTSRGFLLWRFAYAGPTCPPRHHSWGRHPQTFTKAEKLNASICFPLFTQQRTFLRTAALRHKRPVAGINDTLAIE